jgi:transcriptional regulator with XRE-family HTH domain
MLSLTKMTNQEELQKSDTETNKFAKRLAHVLYLSGLNQTEFANRIGVSGGFFSDAIRGLKKPGADILSSINEVFGVSIDWLLAGIGNIYGNRTIDVELLRDIRIQVGIVNAAIAEQNPIAQEVLRLLQEGKLDHAANNTRIKEFLDNISLSERDVDLAIELYNEVMQSENAIVSRENLLAAAVTKIQQRHPIDKLTRLLQNPTSNVHINIIGSQRFVGGKGRKNSTAD